MLVLGSGSGSDIIGALQNGNSVIAFESDLEQFKGSLTRVNEALGAHETYIAHMAPESRPAYLLLPPEVWQWVDADTLHFIDAVPVVEALPAFKAIRQDFRSRTARKKHGEQGSAEGREEDTSEKCFACGKLFSEAAQVLACRVCSVKACDECLEPDDPLCTDCQEKAEEESANEGDEGDTPDLTQESSASGPKSNK